jgi:hypothetical protein
LLLEQGQHNVPKFAVIEEAPTAAEFAAEATAATVPAAPAVRAMPAAAFVSPHHLAFVMPTVTVSEFLMHQ